MPLQSSAIFRLKRSDPMMLALVCRVCDPMLYILVNPRFAVFRADYDVRHDQASLRDALWFLDSWSGVETPGYHRMVAMRHAATHFGFRRDARHTRGQAVKSKGAVKSNGVGVFNRLFV
jgi:hypothetical protein